MTHYQIGDTHLVIEEVACISENKLVDANRVGVDIYLKGGQCVRATVLSEGDEKCGYADAYDSNFLNRAKTWIDEFRERFKNANNGGYITHQI